MIRTALVLPMAALAACSASPHASAPPQPLAPSGGALVTVLGSDTLGVERWTRHGDSIVARVVLRVPRTQTRAQVMRLDADGSMRLFRERVYEGAAASGEPLREETLERAGEGWMRTLAERGRPARRDTVDAPAAALPFVDLVHWPFEVALARATAAGERSGERVMPLLSGGRALAFRARWTSPDEVELVHPLRGPTTARVDAAGRVLAMDAARTTRKVMVTRVARLAAPETFAEAWSRADAGGRAVGELSGRGSAEATVGGARIAVDYGTPARRGRQVFGGVVPWGQVWRTGANRATHLSTTRALVLGDPMLGPTLEVPAGEYTLFSVPAPDGGVLVVNRQTGQNGTAYDPARDLGRVRMRTGKLAEEVERFTIAVRETGPGRGALELSWERTQLSVPFTVR